MTEDKAAPVSGNILVVGGGISGLTTALEAAEVGYEVFLVEKNPYLGGRVAQLNQYFPKLCPPTCGLEINFRRIKDNPNIRVFTLGEVEKVEGTPGNYDVTLTLSPRYVNENCVACNDCVDVCPPKAFTGVVFDPSEPRDVRFRVHLCRDYMRQRAQHLGVGLCGLCVYICPYGLKKQ